MYDATQALTANHTRLELTLAGADWPVLALTDAVEGLSRPWNFRLEVLADTGESLTAALGQPAQVALTAADGYRRVLSGIATAVDPVGVHTDGRHRMRVTVESSLALLRRRRDTRLILGRTLPEIVRQTLERNGIDSGRVRFHGAPQPVRPTTLQIDEDDLAFLHRLLARAGIFYWSVTEEGEELLHFADSANACPAMDREALRYQPPAGMETRLERGEHTGLQRLRHQAAMTAARFVAHDVCESAPENPPEAAHGADVPSAWPYQPEQVHFGGGHEQVEQAEAEARLRAQRADAEGRQLHASGNAADLASGHVCGLDAGVGSPLNGDYLVLSVRHHASQRAGLGAAGAPDLAYGNEAVLLRREVPWRPEIGPRPELPQTFTARIESTSYYPQLDDRGRYRVRRNFDLDPTEHTQASIDLRQLQPHGGPAADLSVGWHLPLHDGDEVLLGCLNTDPDRPFIIGAVPNPSRPSPVTAANAAQHILRTQGENELCLDDAQQKEAITLQTADGQNLLQMSAAVEGHRVLLASRLGLMQLYAKKTLKLQSGDSLTETVGNDRLHTVENRHRTETKKGEIHHQAATDGLQRAGNNIRHQAERNIELTSAKATRLDVERTGRIAVHGRTAGLTVRNGNLHAQAAKRIHLRGKGGGDIRFSQGGAGFILTKGGDVQLFGHAITINPSGGLSLNGQVHYQLTSPPAMPGAGTAAPLQAAAIPQLTAEEAVDEVRDLTLNLEDFWGNELDGHFEELKGRPWRFVSDCGDERTGVVQDRVIQIAGVHVDESFEFDIEGIMLGSGEG